VPIGFLITAGLVALAMGASLWPPSRSGPLGLATWIVSAITNESPFLAFYWLVASTLLASSQLDLDGPAVWVVLGLAASPFLGTHILVRRSLRAAPTIEQALDRDLGRRWRRAAGKSIAARPPWARILFAPLPVFHPGVRRIANLSYGDSGRRNRLDLYQRRRGGNRGPCPRDGSPQRFPKPCCVRRAARRPALVRSPLLDPLRGCHRRYRCVREVSDDVDITRSGPRREGAGQMPRATREVIDMRMFRLDAPHRRSPTNRRYSCRTYIRS
jgi:hypothetical protein